MSDENLKLYEDCLNDLKNLLEEKEENLKCIVNIIVNIVNTRSKDAVNYEINQLKEIIDCQTKDFEQKKVILVNNN